MTHLTHSVVKFEGRILQRGFWLYVWVVSCGENEVLYVGRTGDSSSRFASSPFSRIGQHLDLRIGAKGNALLRNLRAAGLEPTKCSFELFAVGPLFLEQADMESHRRHRDIVAPLENALAVHLRSVGYNVIGNHGCRKPIDDELFSQVLASVNGRFTKPGANSRLQPTAPEAGSKFGRRGG
jgi:hypothetical protein